MKTSRSHRYLRRRTLAGLIDGVFLLMCFQVVGFFLNLTINWWLSRIPGLGPALADTLFFLSRVLFFLAYFTYTESSPAKSSPGKLLCGLVVLNGGEQRLSRSEAFFRSLSKLLGALPLMAGYIMGYFHKRHRCFHDVFSSSDVVEEGPIHPVISRFLSIMPDLDDLFSTDVEEE